MTNPTNITAQPGTPFVDVVRDFDATPAQVFRAWTEPDLIVRWLGPRDKKMELLDFDPHPGGIYRYVHSDDNGRYGFHGVFHTVTPRELIIQTFEFDGAPDQVCLESIRFTEVDGRTRVTLHDVFPSVEARDMAVASGMNGGIIESMERVDELLPEL
jgi:uncharacterized protein YndB with AHSA1/START domain